MKLKYTFADVEMDDGIVMVPVGNGVKEVHSLLKINQAGQEILQLLTADTSENEIVETLSRKYENGRETLQGYVRKVLDTLREAGLLEE